MCILGTFLLIAILRIDGYQCYKNSPFDKLNHWTLQHANLAKTQKIQDIIFREKLDIFVLNEKNLNPMIDTETLNN